MHKTINNSIFRISQFSTLTVYHIYLLLKIYVVNLKIIHSNHQLFSIKKCILNNIKNSAVIKVIKFGKYLKTVLLKIVS